MGDTLADSDSLPPPDVIAREIVDDLEAALEQFRLIAGDLNGSPEQARLTAAYVRTRALIPLGNQPGSRVRIGFQPDGMTE